MVKAYLLESHSVEPEGVVLVTATGDYERVETVLTIERAQELAVEILAKHPLDRVENDALSDWKADATRYLRDSNMLVRRFARRALALADAYDTAQLELTVNSVLRSVLQEAGRYCDCEACKAQRKSAH